MRLAFFLAHYPAPGGTTKAVRGLAQGLMRLGHDVHVISLGNEFKEYKDDFGIVVHQFKRPFLKRFVPFSLKKFISRAKFDLVILNGMFMPEVAILAYLCKSLRQPYVVVPHDPYHPALLKKNHLLKNTYRPIERWTLNNASGVQLLSESHIPLLREYGVTAYAFVVPNGFWEKETIIKPLHPTSVMNLFYIGRLDSWHKGLDLLVEAVSRADCPVRLTLQGPDWGDRKMLRRLADRLGIGDRITFKEADYSREPCEIISEYDVVALTSRYDGFGFTVLEAMLAGRPVLVSREAGIAEHVKRAGCGEVVEPSIAGIAEGLERLWERWQQWQEVGLRGRQYALEHLTWDRIAVMAEGHYRRLIAKRTSKAAK